MYNTQYRHTYFGLIIETHMRPPHCLFRPTMRVVRWDTIMFCYLRWLFITEPRAVVSAAAADGKTVVESRQTRPKDSFATTGSVLRVSYDPYGRMINIRLTCFIVTDGVLTLRGAVIVYTRPEDSRHTSTSSEMLLTYCTLVDEHTHDGRYSARGVEQKRNTPRATEMENHY